MIGEPAQTIDLAPESAGEVGGSQIEHGRVWHGWNASATSESNRVHDDPSRAILTANMRRPSLASHEDGHRRTGWERGLRFC